MATLQYDKTDEKAGTLAEHQHNLLSTCQLLTAASTVYDKHDTHTKMPLGLLQWSILTFNQHQRLQRWSRVYIYVSVNKELSESFSSTHTKTTNDTVSDTDVYQKILWL